jgi:acyl-CoA thioesterase
MNDPLRASAEAMWADDRATSALGMRLEAVTRGRSRLSMTVTEAMTNGHGICHGGFIFALADSAMAFAANPGDAPAVTQHAAITFVRPARAGDALVAEAAERMRSGRSGMYDVRISTEDGESMAEFRGHTRTIRTVAEG